MHSAHRWSHVSFNLNLEMPRPDMLFTKKKKLLKGSQDNADGA